MVMAAARTAMIYKAQPCSSPLSSGCSQSNHQLNCIRLVTQSAEVVIESGFMVPASILDYQVSNVHVRSSMKEVTVKWPGWGPIPTLMI